MSHHQGIGDARPYVRIPFWLWFLRRYLPAILLGLVILVGFVFLAVVGWDFVRWLGSWVVLSDLRMIIWGGLPVG